MNRKKAIQNNHQQIIPEHLLTVLINSSDNYISEILEKSKCDVKSLLNDIDKNLEKIPKITGDNLNIFFSDKVLRILDNTKELKNEFNDKFVSPEIILYSIACSNDPNLSELLNKNRLNKENLKISIIKFRKGKQ